MQQPPTIAELRSGPPTVDLMTAATALGVGRSKAYDLARRGEFPVTVRKIGSSYRVPVAELLAFLGISLVPEQGPRAGTARPGPGPREEPGRPEEARWPSVPRQAGRDGRPPSRVHPPAENPW
jgi:predicted DNA-binding transcriptional regulator AlpA